MRILITGATGLIGRAISEHFFEQGHELVLLTRDPSRASESLLFPAKFVKWDASTEAAPLDAFKDVNAVIHLAGESIAAGRWTDSQKEQIFTSRVNGTRNLVNALKSALREGLTQEVTWIGASAVGIYGDGGDEEITEESTQGSGFLADVCKAWENETANMPGSVRVVNLRLGMVLSSQGGALEKMLKPFELGIGGKIGSGKQWMSWIHVRDVVGLVELALLRREIHGALNATAPNAETNENFSRKLAAALDRKSWLPVPGFILKTVLGEMSDLLLTGARVLPARALSFGYAFKFPELSLALSNVIPNRVR